jgi:hypothetical protein
MRSKLDLFRKRLKQAERLKKGEEHSRQPKGPKK